MFARSFPIMSLQRLAQANGSSSRAAVFQQKPEQKHVAEFSSGRPDLSGRNSQVLAILGGQWGDEGKGKLVDILAKEYDMVARFNGGSNAGHSLVVDGNKFSFHLLPCGVLYGPEKENIIGNGVVLDFDKLVQELEQLDEKKMEYRLLISDRAQMLFEVHRVIDGLQETARGAEAVGTTKKGIGPAYASKATRHGVRVGELLDWDTFTGRYQKLMADLTGMYPDVAELVDTEAELRRYASYRERFAPMIIDSQYHINARLREGKRLLAEGANAALLDIDFGTYPFVTSSSTTAGGVCIGLGIPPRMLETTIGVVKAYTTRVGSGPFPSELEDETGSHLQTAGHEFGTTTGRPRRCGWLDIPLVRYSLSLNGYTSLNLTKLDVLDNLPEVKIGVAYRSKTTGERLPEGLMPSTLQGLADVEIEYETLPGWKGSISEARSFEELPVNAQKYIERVEELVDCPVSWIGTGPDRDQMILKE